MKKNYILAFLLGLSICLLLGAYTRDWTESTPTDNTVANQIDDYNRYVRVDVAERLETYIGGFNASDSNAGFYSVLFIEKATSPSTPAANKYLLYGLLADGKCELVGEDEDGDMIQLSYTGKHMIGSGTAPQAFQYNTTEEDGDGGRESTIRVKGEQSGGEVTTLGYTEISHDGASDDQKGRYRIMLNDGDDSDAPSKCPIEYASDGTIDVTNSVSVVDEDDMTSDSATKVSTQQAAKAYADAYIKLVDSKATTTDGGTFTQDAWQKRTVTEETDVGTHCAVSSSVIVLDAGTYQCSISCPAFVVGRHQARLRNTTGGATILVGTAEAAVVGTSITTRSFIVGRFTIAASQNVEIQHYCETTNPDDGFGLNSATGEAEIYTIAEFWKR